MSRPQRTCHTETSDFHTLLCCLRNLKIWAWAEIHCDWMKTTRFCPHKRIKHDFDFFFFFMKGEQRNTASNRQCPLQPLYTGSQGGMFYCIWLLTPLGTDETPPTPPSSYPSIPEESCCMPHAELSQNILKKKKKLKVTSNFFMLGRKQEIWMVPIRGGFRDQPPGKIPCWGNGGEWIATVDCMKQQSRMTQHAHLCSESLWINLLHLKMLN